MRSALSREQVRSIVDLARLAPSPEDEKRLLDRLQGILAYVDNLEPLDTSDVPPSASVLAPIESWREDEVRDSLPPDVVLRTAPERQGNFFRVPRVIE